MLIPNAAHRRRAYLAAVCALLAAGVAGSVYVYSQVDRTSKLNMIGRVETIAAMLPFEHTSSLFFDPNINSVAYIELKTLLMRVRNANSDVRFVYLMGKNSGGEIFFYADSEDPRSPDYSPLGQEYDEATPLMHDVIDEGVTGVEGPDRDRWGIWMSAYAPVQNEAGITVAMLGMDVPASQYLISLYTYSLLPLLASLILLILLYAMERVRSREARILEQKEEFLSIASHEIRTPLTGIRWAVEDILAGKEVKEGSSARATLGLVLGNSVRLIGRITNLLDMAALENKKKDISRESIQVNAFVKGIVEGLELAARERKVSMGLDRSLEAAGEISADPQMLHHAFFNLLANAIKYTAEGTEVRISYERNEKSHIFRIADRGPGVSPEEQEKIFGGYHRTQSALASKQPGTGMGLYLARRAAELHGGNIHVESPPDGGATFVLQLPA